MNYAIIAAGEGSRLIEEGIKTPKPLIEINGEKMIDRLIRIFSENGADKIYVIINEYMTEVATHIKSTNYSVGIELIEKTTPSSMHSFYELARLLPKEKVCLTTVDTIFREDAFAKYVSAFSDEKNTEALFAVTDFIEDESPLYVDVDKNMHIKGFFDQYYDGALYISGGIYCMMPDAIDVVNKAINNGQYRMRNFQRALISEGININAYRFSKIVDVDHSSDIILAQRFLNDDI